MCIVTRIADDDTYGPGILYIRVWKGRWIQNKGNTTLSGLPIQSYATTEQYLGLGDAHKILYDAVLLAILYPAQHTLI